MACKICGGYLGRESSRLDYCTDCNAKYIHFDTKLKRGSLDVAWAIRKIQSLEAAIGRAKFDPVFKTKYCLDDASEETKMIIRIRALKQEIDKIKKA